MYVKYFLNYEMKNILILFAIIATAFSSYAQDSTKLDFRSLKPKNPDNAVIVIYRGGQFGGALDNFSIELDGKNICKISNARYLYIEVPKGSHELSAFIGSVLLLQKVTKFPLECESGQTYFISTTIKSSIISSRLDLSEVTKNTAVRDLEKCKKDNCQESILMGTN